MEITGQARTAIEIPCCLCGVLILPNSANQCGACLAQQFDLKSILSKGPQGGDLIIHQCRRCRRYQHTESYFQEHEPESASLLALCLKNVPALSSSNSYRSNGLSSVTLLDASWIWTEPHSMRLKLRLTIRADVGESPRCVTVQQRVPIEFHVHWGQCKDCKREYTNRTWQAVVQLRLKRADGGKKGLVMLETAIARNNDIRKHVVGMETSRNGFDFYFMHLMHAASFSRFLGSVYPMKTKSTQKLVSEDIRNNSANIKHTTLCEIVPLSRNDLVICDKHAAQDGASVGRLTGRLALVNKVSSTLQLVDAAPARTNIHEAFADLHAERYWKGEKYYRIMMSPRRLVHFVVLDVELCVGNSYNDNKSNHSDGDGLTLYHGQSVVEKYALADIMVARASDASYEETFHCTSHLGNLLDIGDIVLGYDLVSSVLTGADEWSMNNSFNSSFQMPDVVLVKKVKSGGAMEEAVKGGDGDDGDKKSKVKSSGSKKKERRRKREKKKQKNIDKTFARMGFSGGKSSGGGGDNDDNLWEEERRAFEQDLEKDIELAAEFQSIVEKGKLDMEGEDIIEEQEIEEGKNDENDATSAEDPYQQSE
mmetsp:Transcript_5364/g.7967  ORF Transcript_5364/g.7967 Transcript_5364/m.7967 type:complete len:594 (+) Transcript_5364:95-1876(+)